jgi:hypothetical protein
MSLLEQLSPEEQKQFERFNGVVNVVWERLDKPSDLSLYWVEGTSIGRQVAFLTYKLTGLVSRSGYIEPGTTINLDFLPEGDKLVCLAYLLCHAPLVEKEKCFAGPVPLFVEDSEEAVALRLRDAMGELRKYVEHEASKR